MSGRKTGATPEQIAAARDRRDEMWTHDTAIRRLLGAAASADIPSARQGDFDVLFPLIEELP